MPRENLEILKKDWNEVNDNLSYFLAIAFLYFTFIIFMSSPIFGFSSLSSNMQYFILFVVLLAVVFLPKRWGRDKTWIFLPRLFLQYFREGSAKKLELLLLGVITIFFILTESIFSSTLVELNAGSINFQTFSTYISNLDSALILFGSVLIFIFITGFQEFFKKLNARGIRAKSHVTELVGVGIVIALLSLSSNYLFGSQYLISTIVTLAWLSNLSIFLLLSGLLIIFYLGRKE